MKTGHIYFVRLKDGRNLFGQVVLQHQGVVSISGNFQCFAPGFLVREDIVFFTEFPEVSDPNMTERAWLKLMDSV